MAAKSKPDALAAKPTVPPQRPRWWKWTRRALMLGLILSICGMVALFAARAYYRHEGHRELAVETAKLDADEPGWRWPELKAAGERDAPPADQNSAIMVQRVYAATPQEWHEWVKRPEQSDELIPLNRRQRREDIAGDDDLIAATREARVLGLGLRDRPRGYRGHDLPAVPFLLRLPELDEVRGVTNLLRADALLAAQAGDATHALRAAHAMLNCGRSVQEAPLLICPIVRMASGCRAAETAIRTLALTAPGPDEPELAALQTAFATEAGEPLLRDGLRGERALTNLFFDNLESGVLSVDEFIAAGERSEAGAAPRIQFYFRRALMPGDQARYLRYMRLFVATAGLPPHEQSPAFSQVESRIRADRGTPLLYPFSQLMTPAVEKAAAGGRRHRAELLCAATLIACERFRLVHGRWPESLAEVPKELLAATPLDPYDGTPIKFAKLPDGIAVYTVGAGPERDRDKKRLTNPLGGTELGWRLYDPDARGLPPLPPKEPPDPVADPP